MGAKSEPKIYVGGKMPTPTVEALRERAAANNRSVSRELQTIVEAAVFLRAGVTTPKHLESSRE